MPKLRLTKRYREALKKFLLPRYKNYEHSRMREDFEWIVGMLETEANKPEYNVPVGFAADHENKQVTLERTIHCVRHINGTFLVQFHAFLKKDFAPAVQEQKNV